MSRKNIAVPDSDETARKPDAASDPDEVSDSAGDYESRQTSNKTGKHSSAEKLAASRPEFGSSPGAKPVDGAFGDASPEEAGLRGPRLSLAGTNQFHCESCGRDFNTEAGGRSAEISVKAGKRVSP
jgi:hypothetical protein